MPSRHEPRGESRHQAQESRDQPTRPAKRPLHPHPELILNPQPQPSISHQRRQPAPQHRLASLRPKVRPNERPTRKHSHHLPSVGGISAQLPPELYANYDIDIKPLAVHPIISPNGQLDYAQLSLVPLEQSSAELPLTRKPSGRPFGMPSVPAPRVPLVERPSSRRPVGPPHHLPPQHRAPPHPVPQPPAFGPSSGNHPTIDITELHVEPQMGSRPELNVDPHIHAFKESVLYNAAVLQQHLNSVGGQQQPQQQSQPVAPQKPTVAPQHPGYTAQYQPHASGSQVYHQYQANQLLEKHLAPSLSHHGSQTMTKNGFKPISPQYGFASQATPASNAYAAQPSSHYQFSALNYASRPTTTSLPPTSLWQEPLSPSTVPPTPGKTAKSSLLIIPVPDSHYKADSLNDVIRISKDYPQLFPSGFDFGKVAAMTRTKSEESPAASVYYDAGFGAKNDTKADYIILTVNDDVSFESCFPGDPLIPWHPIVFFLSFPLLRSRSQQGIQHRRPHDLVTFTSSLKPREFLWRRHPQRLLW